VDQARRLQQEEYSGIRRQINLLGFLAHLQQQPQLNHRVVGSLDLRRQILKLSNLMVSLDLFNLSRAVASLDLRRQILNLNKAAGCFQLLERSRRKPSQLGEDSLGRIILHNRRSRVDSSVG